MNSHVQIDEEDEKPLDPAMERVRRKMVRLLVISIGIMMAGLMAVLYAIVYKVTNRSDEVDAVPAEVNKQLVLPGSGFSANLDLPEGSMVVSHNIDGRRLSILTQAPDGSQSIHIVDLAEGAMIGRVELSR